MSFLPSISCACLTYGRPDLLEEAIQSFLLQDYRGKKELVVLNDFSAQELVFDHPEVKIINIKKRFKTIGEKRNACVALCDYDWIAVWDDDDIRLPHRLTLSAQKINEKKLHFKPSDAFDVNDGEISGPKKNTYYASGIWHRSLFDEVGGHSHMNSGEDLDIEEKFNKITGEGLYDDCLSLDQIYYLYRWYGTGSYHLSGIGRIDDENKRGIDKVSEYVFKKIEEGGMSSGKISLVPKWNMDYEKAVKDYLNNITPHENQIY